MSKQDAPPKNGRVRPHVGHVPAGRGTPQKEWCFGAGATKTAEAMVAVEFTAAEPLGLTFREDVENNHGGLIEVIRIKHGSAAARYVALH